MQTWMEARRFSRVRSRVGLVAFCVLGGLWGLGTRATSFCAELRRRKCRSRCSHFRVRPDAPDLQPFLRVAGLDPPAGRSSLATGIFIMAISSGPAGLPRSYLQLLMLRSVGGIGSRDIHCLSAFTLLLTSVESGLRGRAAQGFFRPGSSWVGLPGLPLAARCRPSRSRRHSSSTVGHS